MKKWIAFVSEGGPDCEFETKEAAIVEAPKYLELMSGESFFVARKGPPTAITPNAEVVLEDICGRAYDEDGEATDGWLERVEPREIGALQLLLDEAWRKWLEAYPHHKPAWYTIVEWELHTAP